MVISDASHTLPTHTPHHILGDLGIVLVFPTDFNWHTVKTGMKNC